MELIEKHIDRITDESLRDLAEMTGDPCLSIYMPTHRIGSEAEQDPIRLKNLVSEAENRLLEAGKRRPDVERVLEPIRALVDDYEFWQHQSDGLAIFRTPESMFTYRLPTEFEELSATGERPHIKPLLPLLTANGHFYLLALSQDQVRFFHGTRLQIGEIELHDTPSSLEEAMRFDEYESQLQFQTGTGTASDAGRAAVFHGHSDAGDEAVIKENIKRFLHRVDDGVRDHVRDERTPLVLAGVEFMRGLYREAGQYPSIVDDGIDGNPEMLDARELHERAYPIVEPLFSEAVQEDTDRYMHLVGTDDARASSELADVVSSAYFQRVDTLFVPENVQRWGSFDPEQNQVRPHESKETADHDLLDFAAIHTLLNGGRVYVMQEGKMPQHATVAAIYRYG